MDSTYAPQSPDLSGFLSSPSKQQTYATRKSAPTSSYAPRSPVIPSSFGVQATRHQAHLQSFDGGAELGYGNNTYMPPIPPLPATHTFESIPQETGAGFKQLRAVREDLQYPSITVPTQPRIKPGTAKIKNEDNEYLPTRNAMTTSTRAPRQCKNAPAPAAASSSTSSDPPASLRNPNPNSIIIRTKFPVARIKRIMQADEEVGKVAQVTPVAVSKALELFMIALVGGAADKAKEGGGKRISAGHLKGVVDGDERWDFLKEIVARVGEKEAGTEEEGGKKGKGKRKLGGSESEESESEEGKGKKKRGRGGRKKKGGDD